MSDPCEGCEFLDSATKWHQEANRMTNAMLQWQKRAQENGEDADHWRHVAETWQKEAKRRQERIEELENYIKEYTRPSYSCDTCEHELTPSNYEPCLSCPCDYSGVEKGRWKPKASCLTTDGPWRIK